MQEIIEVDPAPPREGPVVIDDTDSTWFYLVVLVGVFLLMRIGFHAVTLFEQYMRPLRASGPD